MSTPLSTPACAAWPPPKEAEDLLDTFSRTINTPWWRANAILDRSVRDQNLERFEATLVRILALHADPATVFHGGDQPSLAPILGQALNKVCAHPSASIDASVRLTMVDRLLAVGADPGHVLDMGLDGWLIPLYGAATLGLWPVVERLLDAGADPLVVSVKDCWFAHLIRTGDRALIHRVLDRVDLPALVVSLDVAVDWAIRSTRSSAESGETQALLIQDLLHRGLPLNAINREPSLVTACREACLESLDALLDAGADPLVRLPHRVYPAKHQPPAFPAPPPVVLLGDPDEPGTGLDEGWTLLHKVALRVEQAPLVHRLADRGVPVNQPSSMGFTPLHTAAMGCCDVATVQALLDRGADILAQDGLGRTPLDLAVAYNPNSSGTVILERLALHRTIASSAADMSPTSRMPRPRL